jgi:excisionase family DNA binding protein
MDDFVNVQEAAQSLGVNRRTIWRLIRQGRLRAFPNPIDHRAKLVRREDVQKLARPETDGAVSAEVGPSRAHGRDRQQEAPDSGARPRPRIAGIVNDPSVQSRDIEDYMREHWRPE